MFLKSLELNGFKSFPDKTRIEFSEGITSLLGPNGCGKSNIVDSIKWVLGAQSKKALRASSMEDVIFKGTDRREALNMAEVTLLIDNSEHHLSTDITELTIRRRLYRSGQSEYFINGEKCLLKNITDLFMDTGVGKASYSIMEQGKIDQILSNKPEDRRYIFEEAAGISRFKHKIQEAQNNIERSNENIEKLEILRDQAKRTYDRTRSQAERAIEWENLRDEAFSVDVDYHLARLLVYKKTAEFREGELNEAKKESEEIKERLSLFQDDIKESETLVNQERSKLFSIQSEISRNEGKLEGLTNTISALDDRYREALINKEERSQRIESIKRDIDSLSFDIERLEESLSESEDILDERESEIAFSENKERALEEERASSIENATKAENRVDEIQCELKALSEELKIEIEALIDGISSSSDLSLYEKAKSSFQASIKSLTDEIDKNSDYIHIKELSDELIKRAEEFFSSVPDIVNKLISPDGFIKTKERIEEMESNLRSESEEKKTLSQDLRARAEKLEEEIHSQEALLSELKVKKVQLEANISALKAQAENLSSQKDAKENEYESEIERSESYQRSIDDLQEKIRFNENEKERLEALDRDLIKNKESLEERIRNKSSLLSEKATQKESLYKALNDAASRAESASLRIQNLEVMEKELFTQFYEKYSRNLGEYLERMRDDLPQEEESKNRLDDLSRKILSLGSINHLAKDEFQKAEDEYQFLSKELDDCYKSKEDMEKILREILDRSIELFAKTYEDIKVNFREMFRRLFGGGRAELSLTDPENILTSGIEISAEPPGKKLTALSLLSGGERTMTAIALLFATYQVKPSPFCLLDEIDAALDARNIGYFLDVLKEFAKTSQFIIITHNKHTVTGGDTMLGVSQQEPGVSKAVSYRIGNERGKPVILDEEDLVVDFDTEGRLK